MYKSIYVPVDNSDHSNRAVACALGLGKAYSAKLGGWHASAATPPHPTRAVACALGLGKAYSAKLVGCHVYAAKLHDYRFRQMEYTLPEGDIEQGGLAR